MDKAQKFFKLTQEQEEKLQTLKKQVDEEASKRFGGDLTAISKVTDNDHLIRLLFARDFNEKKSFEMWKKWVDWRVEFRVDNIKDEEIDLELRSGKAFWHKNDKKGNPVLVVKTKRHYPKDSSVEQVIRFGVYLIEIGVKEAEKTTGKLSVVWDRQGFTMKNYDKRFFTLVKKFTGVLQDNYAERLDTFYILHPNWFFKTVYAVVKPFLTQRTKDKIVLINNQKDLMKHFDPDCLLKEHGGTSSFFYKYKDVSFGDETDIQAESAEEDEDLKKAGKEMMEEAGVKEDLNSVE